MNIDLVGISKRFGELAVLQGIDLRIASGELMALLGPSGSGKTTLLRIIAGLEWQDAGDVHFDGQSAIRHTARERRVGFVFQHYALFRHMTVFENVAFGLRVRPRHERPGREEIRKRVDELLKLVQMGWLAGRYPNELSGGQRQRVALARALAVEPRVLLLDEPFGALDTKVRQELRRWLRRLHDDTGVTSIFVTHDQEEALELADRVVILSRGRIEQVGTPDEIYDSPANLFVYEFLGKANRVTYDAHSPCVAHRGLVIENIAAAAASGAITAYVRPHDIDLIPRSDGPGIVRSVARVGPVVRLDIEVPDSRDLIEVEVPRERFAALNVAPGARVSLRTSKARLF